MGLESNNYERIDNKNTVYDFWRHQILWRGMKKIVLPSDCEVASVEDNIDQVRSIQFNSFIEKSNSFTFYKDIEKQNDVNADSLDCIDLSIVVTTRNDTHVERMEDRTQIFIDSILHLANKYQTKVELIIVDWNPPSNRLQISKAFTYPDKHEFVSINIIQVSNEIHNRYYWAESLPLYQMIAKNVGIRRARGSIILATNIDILFSEKLFIEISSGRLIKGNLYRSNRWDVNRAILDIPIDEQLNKGSELCIQINYRNDIIPYDIVKKNQDIDYNKPKNDTILPSLHTMACGDFQVLHRDDWFKVRGYSELDAYSYHLDSLFALTCYHAGINEVVFDDSYAHYHIDHTLGVKVETDQYEINENKVILHISMLSLTILHIIQSFEKDFILTNENNWGLADDALPEECVTVAKWEEGIASTTKAKPIQFNNQNSSLLNLDTINSLINYTKLDKYIDNYFEGLIAIVRRATQTKGFYIWGIGEMSKMFVEMLNDKITIDGFIHGGDKEHMMNTNIMSSEDYLSSKLKHNFVLIASMFYEDISDLIEQHNGKLGVDYLQLF